MRAEPERLPHICGCRYLRLPSVLRGFCQLMQQLFGLELRTEPVPPAEAWAPGVLKLQASHPEGLAGTVYLDLCRCACMHLCVPLLSGETSLQCTTGPLHQRTCLWAAYRCSCCSLPACCCTFTPSIDMLCDSASVGCMQHRV